MTEANLQRNLRGLSSCLTNRCTVFIVRRGLYTIPGKNWLRLMQPTLVAEFDKVCTQFEEKPLYTYLGGAGHLVPPSSVRGHRGLLGKTSYTLIRLASFPGSCAGEEERDPVHTSRMRQVPVTVTVCIASLEVIGELRY